MRRRSLLITLINLHGNLPLACGFAADAVDPSRTLLDGSGIPTEIIMNDVPTMPVEIDSLLSYLRADKDVRQHTKYRLSLLEPAFVRTLKLPSLVRMFQQAPWPWDGTDPLITCNVPPSVIK